MSRAPLQWVGHQGKQTRHSSSKAKSAPGSSGYDAFDNTQGHNQQQDIGMVAMLQTGHAMAAQTSQPAAAGLLNKYGARG